MDYMIAGIRWEWWLFILVLAFILLDPLKRTKR